jgi:hypothetical chaperone protein
VVPVQLKTLQSLIFNDLAFSFYNQVESSKIALSDQGSTIICLKDENIDIWELYTRSQFEADINKFKKQIENVVLTTIEDSGLEPDQIDAVVRTGGSSNIPLFIEMLGEMFGEDKVVASDAFNSVTTGLAIRASTTAL